MKHALELARINVVSETYGTMIIEILAREKHASFKMLRHETNLSSEKLRMRLGKLQKHRLVRGEITDPKDGSYLFYCLTQSGKDIRLLLHDFLHKSDTISPETLTRSFVVDEDAFRYIMKIVGIDGLKRIFHRLHIVLTDDGYSKLKQLAYEQNDEILESFLGDEDRVIIHSTYHDEVSCTKTDYHLRRIKKLTPDEARLVVSAMDAKASLITNRLNVQSAATSLGVACASADAVANLGKEEFLPDKFFEMSLKPDIKDMSLTIRLDPISLTRKLRDVNTTTKTMQPDMLSEFIPKNNIEKISKYAVHEMIVRLNGIHEHDYSAMISYDAFKSLGKIYERRYQKDVQASVEVLDPVLEIIDKVFTGLSENQEKMKTPIQNSFMLAFAESTFLNLLGSKKQDAIKKSLNFLSSANHSPALIPLLIADLDLIRAEKIFDVKTNSHSNMLYSLTAAKKKIERDLDLMLCTFDKKSLQSTCSITSSKKRTAVKSPPDTSTRAEYVDERLKSLIANQEWKTRQGFSLSLNNPSKRTESFWLDTKCIPDANDLDKILSIPSYCENKKINAKTLAKSIDVTPRMATYYLDAAEMLELIKKNGNYYTPTDLFNKLEKYSNRDYEEIIKSQIKKLSIVNAFFSHLQCNKKTRFTTNDIAKFLQSSTDLAQSTSRRRANTISSWLQRYKIIKKSGSCFYIENEKNQTSITEFPGGWVAREMNPANAKERSDKAWQANHDPITKKGLP